MIPLRKPFTTHRLEAITEFFELEAVEGSPEGLPVSDLCLR